MYIYIYIYIYTYVAGAASGPFRWCPGTWRSAPRCCTACPRLSRPRGCTYIYIYIYICTHVELHVINSYSISNHMVIPITTSD